MFLTSEYEEERVFLITRKNEYFWVPDLHFPLRDAMDRFHEGCLLDGELVKENIDGREEIRYLVFDCLALDGRILISRSLDKRLGILRKDLYEPYRDLCNRFPEDIKMFPFMIVVKPMELSYGLQKVFYELIPRLKHVSDGLIFTARERGYVFGTDEHILKWKPIEENTVDFQLVLEFAIYTDPDAESKEDASYTDYDSKPTCHLYAWHGGQVHKPYGKLFLTDEEWEKLKQLNEPLDERVIECYQDSEGRWRYLRFRGDKDTGNHISVVEKVLESIKDAVSKEELLAACSTIRDRWKEREKIRSKRNGSVSGVNDMPGPLKRIKTDDWK
ncbi:Ceg1p [Sugiyamaella lignohabitans]|uniref:mRNA-capping enzyme subunit alpha n=1 Tax=Sugiyamaella lignohabitans TaxID=796027 RepID=A0A161HJT6_9ASCO|nr:Ceg1p [Sugiyamaella lignohabitans]ANB13047.1 Ceg1p [Sugiyamaella lignohabitans]